MARRLLTGLSIPLAMLIASGCVNGTGKKPHPLQTLKPLPRPEQIRPGLPAADPYTLQRPVPAQIPSVPTYSTPATGRVPGSWSPPVPPKDWAFVVIHHSATPSGSAAAFDREHRAKGWDELGYHFVIGNGNGTADGQIEIGPRWRKQKYGAHAKTPDNRYNEYGIGICLVGNFDGSLPTRAQMDALARLTAWLQAEYSIPAERVITHKDTKPTACPGRLFNSAQLRSMSAQILAKSGVKIRDQRIAFTPTGELMYVR